MAQDSQSSQPIGAAEEDLPFLPEGLKLFPKLDSKLSFTSLAASLLCLTLLLLAVIWYSWPRKPIPTCPFYMRHALCNWARLHGHAWGAKANALAVSEQNQLWVEANETAMRLALGQVQLDASIHEHLCDFMELWLPELGLNGLMDLFQGVQDWRDRGEASVWGLALELPDDLTDLSEDWKHDLGAYIVARLKTHAVANVSSYINDAVEVAGSLKLGGGPLHAITWMEMISFLRSKGWKDAGGLWDFGRRCCKPFQGLPNLFVHCLHGVGHGAMAAGVLLALDQRQRDGYERLKACDQIRDGTAGHRISEEMLDIALGICRDAVEKQFGYICAGGVYMEFWKSRKVDWEPLAHGALPNMDSVSILDAWTQKAVPPENEAWAFEHACLFSDFPATCFRFEPGLGVETLSEGFRELKDMAIHEPCSQGEWSRHVAWPLRALRGCVLGRSFHLYVDYDLWRHGRYVLEQGRHQSRLLTLAEWCYMYEPAGSGALSNKTRIPRMTMATTRVRSYGNWLACIAGAMARVAFQVEDASVDEAVVREHCLQILDPKGYQLCVDMGMSRRRDLEHMMIWPVDVLELPTP